ncbi:hypothetical protein PBI_COUNT_124 [Microbacterium phage Count]|nr:hypothetical protein PBI_COUNT_124 [Microbacterium phage Count]
MRKRKPKHSTAVMTYPFTGESVHIDEKMVPLMDILWKAGVETQFCCEGDHKFIDPTEWDARDHRAYILMTRTDNSLEFVKLLLGSFYAFTAEKVSWTIEFDRNPHDDVNRILLRFPQHDILPLVEFIRQNVIYADILREITAQPRRGGMRFGERHRRV